MFPQQFFPQLTISVVVFPNVADFGTDAPRFEDNPVIRGAIPDLAAETMSVLRRHMSVRSYVNGAGRREQLDYPVEAVREAIVNAVLHRDYSNVTRGTQIQVELHPDQLVVRSPGSLYGLVRVENLGTDIFRNLPSRFEVEFSRSPVMEWADPPSSTSDIVAMELRRRGRANAAHLVTVAGRSRAAVLHALRALIAEGVVETEEIHRARNVHIAG